VLETVSFKSDNCTLNEQYDEFTTAFKMADEEKHLQIVHNVKLQSDEWDAVPVVWQ